MTEGNGSAYVDVTKKYLKGRTPFRVWMFSSLIAALTIVVYNLVNRQAILQGFFSVFFINLAITIPLFLAQAHFVGMTLQKKPKNAKTTLIVVLLIGWVVLGILIAWFMASVYESGMNSGTWLMLFNFLLLPTCWWMLSLLTFRVHKVKLPQA
jgi:hypothetical protein